MSDVRRALIVQGGWDGHQPAEVADLFREILLDEGFEVLVSDTLATFADHDLVAAQSLVIPVWTMGEIKGEERDGVSKAVKAGVGLAGCHGGMCDAFRSDTEWQWMTGSQFVAHPGDDGVRYPVNIRPDQASPITEGMSDFEVASEQYYLHVDPSVRVLADTPMPLPGVGGPHENDPCRMPVVYTKHWGAGRVFYNALGHQRSTLEASEPRELMRRGFLWAVR